jgi:hypothetical protein
LEKKGKIVENTCFGNGVPPHPEKRKNLEGFENFLKSLKNLSIKDSIGASDGDFIFAKVNFKAPF